MKKVQWNSNYDQRIIEMVRILSQIKNLPINSIIEKAVLVFIENECFQNLELEENNQNLEYLKLHSLMNEYDKKDSTNIVISIRKDREGLLKAYKNFLDGRKGLGQDYLDKIISKLTPEWFSDQISQINLDDEKHLASNLRDISKLIDLRKAIDLINAERNEIEKYLKIRKGRLSAQKLNRPK